MSRKPEVQKEEETRRMEVQQEVGPRFWEIDDGKSYLISAFFDGRLQPPVVRIVALLATVAPPLPWCQLWYNSTGSPEVTSTSHFKSRTGQ